MRRRGQGRGRGSHYRLTGQPGDWQGGVARCARSCWQHRHRHKYNKIFERSAVWAAMSSLITRAVLDGALPTSIFALLSSPHSFSVLRGMRVTSMYTSTVTIIIQKLLVVVPSLCLEETRLELLLGSWWKTLELEFQVAPEKQRNRDTVSQTLGLSLCFSGYWGLWWWQVLAAMWLVTMVTWRGGGGVVEAVAGSW